MKGKTTLQMFGVNDNYGLGVTITPDILKTILSVAKYPIYYAEDSTLDSNCKWVKQHKLTIVNNKIVVNGIQYKTLRVNTIGFYIYNTDGYLFRNNRCMGNQLTISGLTQFIKNTKTPQKREMWLNIISNFDSKAIATFLKNRMIKPLFDGELDNYKRRFYINNKTNCYYETAVPYYYQSQRGIKKINVGSFVSYIAYNTKQTCGCCSRQFIPYDKQGNFKKLIPIYEGYYCPECVKEYVNECSDCKRKHISKYNDTQCNRCTNFYIDGESHSYETTPPVWFKYELDYKSKNEKIITKKTMTADDYLTDYVKTGKGAKVNELKVGLEYELETNYESDELKEFQYDIVNKFHDLRLYFTRDGSLSCGTELHTHPMTIQALKHSKLIEYLEKCHDINVFNNTCGLHIHLNRDAFSKYHLLRFCQFIINNPNLSIYVGRRSDNSRLGDYASWNQTMINRDLYKMVLRKSTNVNSLNLEGKMNAINFQHPATIELRYFGNTKTPKYFYSKFEYIQAVFNVTKFNSGIDNGRGLMGYLNRNKNAYRNLIKHLNSTSYGRHCIRYSKGCPEEVETY